MTDGDWRERSTGEIFAALVDEAVPNGYNASMCGI
jgi:hypothetical protein